MSDALVACKSKPTAKEESPVASATARASASPSARPAPSAGRVPRKTIPAEVVRKNINPRGIAEHSGPTGVVRGIVRAAGDPPVDVELEQANLDKAECAPAKGFYEKAFREGPGRTLADVLVGVVGYDAFVPPQGDGPRVVVRDCAFDTRTIALTFGQSIEVVNKGGQSLIPNLVGERERALLVAIPGGEPVRLYPTSVGHYALVDDSHPFAVADVFVLRFSTFDVTGIDGRFEVGRLPPGEVQVSAFLPAIGQTVKKTVTVEAGKTVDVDFEIPFDEDKHPIVDPLAGAKR